MVSSVYCLLAGLVNMPAQIWGALFATMHLSRATASSWLPPVNSASTSHTVSLFILFIFLFFLEIAHLHESLTSASNNGVHQQIKGFTAVHNTQGNQAFTQNHLAEDAKRPTWDVHGMEQEDSSSELCFLLFPLKN